jgi:Uma2 family endonuclease
MGYDDFETLVLNDGFTYGANAEQHMQGSFTIEDYRALPDDLRVELIDGYFIYMEAPNSLHQFIAGEVYRQIANFIRAKGGGCTPFVSPIDVQLDCDEHTMVQPDVVILCDDEKLKLWGIYGAPDFVLEIISPSTRKKDFTKKLAKYDNAGVREYWILDPYDKKLLVYFFENDVCCPAIYGLDKPVPVNLYGGELVIEFGEIEQWIKKFGV